MISSLVLPARRGEWVISLEGAACHVGASHLGFEAVDGSAQQGRRRFRSANWTDLGCEIGAALAEGGSCEVAAMAAQEAGSRDGLLLTHLPQIYGALRRSAAHKLQDSSTQALAWKGMCIDD